MMETIEMIDMIKVLIVEDNKLALGYLKSLIDWERYGFKVVAAVLDGEVALKRFKELSPQLIITDIQMPIMSGVELARNVREIDKDIRIVFLSSYQEFDYARSALDLDVSDYLLKHELSEQSLIEVLAKAKNAIQEKASVLRLKFENALVESLGGNTPIAAKPDDERYLLIAFECDRPLLITREIWLLPKPDMNQVKKVCNSTSKSVLATICIEDGRFLSLVSQSDEPAEDFAYNLKKTLEASFGYSFSVLIVSENARIGDSGSLYDKYKYMFCSRFFSKRSIVMNSIFFESAGLRADASIDTDLLVSAIKTGDADGVLKLVDAAFSVVLKGRDFDGLLAVSRTLTGVLKGYETTDSLIDDKQFRLISDGDIDRLYTAKGVAEFFREKFISLIDYVECCKTDPYSITVKSAIRHIIENYANADLSVADIAESLGMSADRLGILFKRDTGQSVREYLNSHRIEKSKTLIESGAKISEIHNQVGYLTSQYFSRVFLKVTGITPLTYRRKQLRRNGS
ncbi:MAG: response regulator [Oscillospiraceae bacterium]|nr:response regulator [Oscillospiraceae bacterium]